MNIVNNILDQFKDKFKFSEYAVVCSKNIRKQIENEIKENNIKEFYKIISNDWSIMSNNFFCRRYDIHNSSS